MGFSSTSVEQVVSHDPSSPGTPQEPSPLGNPNNTPREPSPLGDRNNTAWEPSLLGDPNHTPWEPSPLGDPNRRARTFVARRAGLLQFGAWGTINAVVRAVKALTAKKLGGELWQRGFHDHALRRDEDLLATARYVVANPLRAGLVTRLADYPHWDAIWL